MNKILVLCIFLVSSLNAKEFSANDINLVRSLDEVKGCNFIANVNLKRNQKVLSLIKDLKNKTFQLGGDTLLLITETTDASYDTASIKFKYVKAYKCE